MRRNDLFWGLILIFFGGMLLLDNLNILPPSINVWSLFWPLLLIFFGVRGILSATNARGQAQSLSIPLETTQSATLSLNHAAGKLELDDTSDPLVLLRGEFHGGIEESLDRSGSDARLTINPVKVSFSNFWPFDGSQNLDWTLQINRAVVVNQLNVKTGASTAWLNLRNLTVREMKIESGASAAEVIFPESGGHMHARLSTGAASFVATIPAQVAARITVQGAMNSISIDSQRFPDKGNHTYQSADYGDAQNQLDLSIDAGVGSITIR